MDGSGYFKIITEGILEPGDLILTRDATTDGGKTSTGHIRLYIGEGKFAHASSPTNGVLISEWTESTDIASISTKNVPVKQDGKVKYRTTYVLRLKDDYANLLTESTFVNIIVWPDGSSSSFETGEVIYDNTTPTSSTVTSEGLFNPNWEIVGIDKITNSFKEYTGEFSGLPKVMDIGGRTEGFLQWIMNGIGDFFDYALGIILMGLKVQLIGWTTLIENMITSIIEFGTNSDIEGNITIESIVYNRVSLFDANIFNIDGQEKVEQPESSSITTEQVNDEEKGYLPNSTESVEGSLYEGEITSNDNDTINVIRENIANWYYALRYLCIIGLLITLIYLGIRMALSSIGEQKAKYKQMCIAWVVGFLITFFIHYFMIAVVTVNQTLIDIFSQNVSQEESMHELFRVMAYEIPLSSGWQGTIIYMFLVYYLVKFAFIYMKRFFATSILCILSPIVGISYAIDKIKENKSPSLKRWATDYSFNVLIQSVHALVYTLFVTIAFDLVTGADGIFGAILAFIVLGFMTNVDKLLQKMFKFNNAGTLKYVLDDATSLIAGVAGVYGLLKTQIRLEKMAVIGAGSLAVRGARKAAGAISGLGNRRYRDYYGTDDENYATDSGNYNTSGDYDFREAGTVNVLTSPISNIDARINREKQKNKQERREYLRSQLQFGKNLASGAAQMMMSVPMTIISPKAAATLALRGMNQLGIANRAKKTIPGYAKQKKKGRFVASVASGGLSIIMMRHMAKSNVIKDRLHKEYKTKMDFYKQARSAEIDLVNEFQKLSNNGSVIFENPENTAHEEIIKLKREQLDSLFKQAMATIPDKDIDDAISEYMARTGKTSIEYEDIGNIVLEINSKSDLKADGGKVDNQIDEMLTASAIAYAAEQNNVDNRKMPKEEFTRDLREFTESAYVQSRIEESIRAYRERRRDRLTSSHDTNLIYDELTRNQIKIPENEFSRSQLREIERTLKKKIEQVLESDYGQYSSLREKNAEQNDNTENTEQRLNNSTYENLKGNVQENSQENVQRTSRQGSYNSIDRNRFSQNQTENNEDNEQRGEKGLEEIRQMFDAQAREGAYNSIDRNRFKPRTESIANQENINNMPDYIPKVELSRREVNQVRNILQNENITPEQARTEIKNIIGGTVERKKESLKQQQVIELFKGTIKDKRNEVLNKNIETQPEFDGVLRAYEKLARINEQSKEKTGQAVYAKPENLVDEIIETMKLRKKVDYIQ